MPIFRTNGWNGSTLTRSWWIKSIYLEKRDEMKKEKTANLCHILWKIFPFIGTAIWGVFCITDNLGYDEAYTAALISHPVGELVEITAQDVHAPFYYILLIGDCETPESRINTGYFLL